MNSRSILRTLCVIFLCAILLHGYQAFYLAEVPSPGFFLWSLVPYVVASLLIRAAHSLVAAIAGSSVALAIDLYMHYQVFIAPKGSTAALGLLFAPLWSALILVPIACFFSHLVLKKAQSNLP